MFSAAATNTGSQDAPPLFAGVFFLLSGFDLPTQTQLSGALEQHGGVNVNEYDESCTHVIVSRTFLWDDPVCAAARKDGKCLSTEIWVSDSLDLGAIQDVNHVIYRPLRDSQGIPGSKNLVVCLTGYQGQARRNVMRMVHLMGAHFSKPLIANRVTHLVCYKFEGEKFNLAKQLGLKLVNHLWLEDCLQMWALMLEDDYSRSGLEVELSEAEAKDSEDDGNLKPMASNFKVSNGADLVCLERAREEVKLQMQMENLDTGFLSEHCPQEKINSAYPSPNLLSPKKKIITGVSEEVKKVSTRDTFVGETQAERREAGPSSPVVIGAKKRKSVGSPSEMASNSKRKNFKGNADASGGISREVENQRGGESRSLDEAVCGVQLEGGFLSKTGNSLKLTTLANSNGNFATVEVQSKNPVSKKDENRASSPTAGETTCNAIVCEEENMPSAALSKFGTPQSAKAQKHNSGLGTDLDSTFLNHEGRLHDNGVAENIPMEITDKDLRMEVTETVCTPSTSKIMTATSPLPPASTLAKEPENHLQLKSSSVNKSTEMSRLPKNNSARKVKSKVAQNILCMDSKSVNSPPEEVNVVNLLVKSSLKGPSPATSIVKTGDTAKQARDPSQSGEQKMPCSNMDESTREMQIKKSKLLGEEIGNMEAHHSQELAQNAKTNVKVSGSNKRGKLKHTLNSKSSEKPGPMASLAGETMVLDKENAALFLPLDKKKTADNDNNTLLEGPGRKADKQSMLSIKKNLSKENTRERQARESKLPEVKDSPMTIDSRKETGRPAETDSRKMSGANKRGKVLKKPDTISVKTIKSLTVEKKASNKENASVCQSRDRKGEPKTSQKALMARKSHEKVASPDADTVPGKVKPTIQRCFALSGRRQELKPLQALVRKLGGKLCRDSHQWSHQTTHLVIAGQLRRTEKLFAAAAAGRWILREDYLKDSSVAGIFLDEKKYEWHGPGMTKDGCISFEAPRKWRELREKTDCCALEGFRILLYGECLIPSLDTLRRAIRAGGADLVATCPPYTRFLASKVDFAIVNPGTPKNDQWIQEFLNHSVACVTTDFFVDLVCKPSSSLDRHILYDTHHLVQALLTRAQASNTGVKRDAEGSNDVGGEEGGGDEISCVACGQSDREDVMLLCGDDKGSGCGTAMHIDCCRPPLDKVPAHDWYCVQCAKPPSPLKKRRRKTAVSKG